MTDSRSSMEALSCLARGNVGAEVSFAAFAFSRLGRLMVTLPALSPGPLLMRQPGSVSLSSSHSSSPSPLLVCSLTALKAWGQRLNDAFCQLRLREKDAGAVECDADKTLALREAFAAPPSYPQLLVWRQPLALSNLCRLRPHSVEELGLCEPKTHAIISSWSMTSAAAAK